MSLNALVERTLAAEFAGAAVTTQDEQATRAAGDKAAARAIAYSRKRKKAAKVAAGDQAKSPSSQIKAG